MGSHLTVPPESGPACGGNVFFSEAEGNYFNFLDHTEDFAIELFLSKALQSPAVVPSVGVGEAGTGQGARMILLGVSEASVLPDTLPGSLW